MLNSYIPMAKLAAQLVAGFGVSKIVADIVKNNVVVTSTVQDVSVKVGGFVLGSMLIEQSSQHIDRQINDVVAWYEKKNASTNASE